MSLPRSPWCSLTGSSSACPLSMRPGCLTPTGSAGLRSCQPTGAAQASRARSKARERQANDERRALRPSLDQRPGHRRPHQPARPAAPRARRVRPTRLGGARRVRRRRNLRREARPAPRDDAPAGRRRSRTPGRGGRSRPGPVGPRRVRVRAGVQDTGPRRGRRARRRQPDRPRELVAAADPRDQSRGLGPRPALVGGENGERPAGTGAGRWLAWRQTALRLPPDMARKQRRGQAATSCADRPGRGRDVARRDRRNLGRGMQHRRSVHAPKRTGLQDPRWTARAGRHRRTGRPVGTPEPASGARIPDTGRRVDLGETRRAGRPPHQAATRRHTLVRRHGLDPARALDPA